MNPFDDVAGQLTQHFRFTAEPCQGPDGQVGLFGNYTVAMDRMGDFLRLVLNTTFLTAASIVFQVFTCSLAGFAFAKLRFTGRRITFVDRQDAKPAAVIQFPSAVCWAGPIRIGSPGVDRVHGESFC